MGAQAAAAFVAAIHIAFVAWMCLAPFSRDEATLGLYLVLAPALWLHWALNDDTCALTALECYFRGVPADRSFFHAVVSPVYKIPDAAVRAGAWLASGVLWVVAAARLRGMVARRAAAAAA